MAQYVDIDYVKLVGSMPPSDIDDLEASFPGTFDGIATAVSRLFDARLAKRYATPFSSPYPEAIRWNVAQVVAAQLWLKRGYNPGSAQDDAIQGAKTEAMAWLKEAADSKEGLVELPLRETPPDAIKATRSGPLSYSEFSSYSWADVQRERLRSGRR